MPNSTLKTWERRRRRIWSVEDKDWIAPPYVEGDPEAGPEFHNRNTYANWHCRCRVCKADNSRKQIEWQYLNPPCGSAPAAEPPSSGALSAGSGATLTA